MAARRQASLRVGNRQHTASPATGQPHTTQATAAVMTCMPRPRRTPAAAHVTVYIAKLLGSRLVAAVNMPQLVTSRMSR